MFALGTVFGLAIALPACDPTVPPGVDASVPVDVDGGGDGVSGRVEVRLRSSEMDAETSLETGILEIAGVRARNDRGELEEPRWDEVGAWELDEHRPLEAPGLPATYGGVLIEWAGSACQVSLLVSSGDAADLDVCLSGLPPLDLRCESPVELVAGSDVRIEARLQLRALDGPLRDAGLEDEDRIDAASEPELHGALVAAWQDAWSLRCRLRGSGDS